ncbi:SGNH/GDSL hydrolase family protein [Mycolicibacter heraklionensis]|uniref:SGNH/GDSL hydrolase family protein n=1 Tax=Mycolicibacter heraklionensis TaxID=512402 RepID=A0A9X7WIK1_9MYCO|nr:SGNH/GDSL hydrolase family protein [Mycolicibacter heraklionensis]QZA08776.1 SGNH/GDSL hydrolase family protein [Mycolicibacter heraklionensis]
MAIRATRRSAVTLGTAGAFAFSGTLYLGVRNLLAGQADRARQTIPKAWDLPPRADGLYGADDTEVQPFHRGANVDLHLMVFGDSTATGYGCRAAEEVPGALIAKALAQRTGLRVRLSTKAIVGATSKGLAGQVDAMFVAGPPPDVAVIMIGANDVTALNSIAGSVQRLRAAVKRLRASGAVVIVGTCPKFGAISAIPRPLRWVAHVRACQLARAQTLAVKAVGGIAVPFADFRAREFHDSPHLLFAADQYHPSAAGYALAAGQMIPALCAALDRPDSRVVASSG